MRARQLARLGAERREWIEKCSADGGLPASRMYAGAHALITGLRITGWVPAKTFLVSKRFFNSGVAVRVLTTSWAWRQDKLHVFQSQEARVLTPSHRW